MAYGLPRTGKIMASRKGTRVRLDKSGSEGAERLCVYCGAVPATTRDHIVPKCLFPEPLPELITAPACLKCNQDKARDEPYLRDVLAVDLRTSEQPAARTIFDGKMARARSRNRSEIARAARQARMEPLHTRGGIYLGHYATIPLDGERISRVIGMMMRGLYWRLRGELFPRGYTIEVARVEPLEVRAVEEAISGTHFNGPYRLGDGIFECVMQFAAEDTGETLWLLRFYRNYVVLVTTEAEAPKLGL